MPSLRIVSTLSASQRCVLALVGSSLLVISPSGAYALSGYVGVDTEKQPFEASWDEALGDEDTVALYGSFDWGHDAGGYWQESAKKDVSWHTQCGGGLDGGVIFRNQRRSVVKAVAQASATEKSARATSEVFAFGKTIWKNSGPGSLPAKSIKSEFNAISYPVIPGVITARVSAYTQAELGLATSVKGSSAPVSCASTATPSAKSTLGASVNLDLIGFDDVSLGSFGIGGQVKAFDLKLPTQGGIGMKEKKLEENLKSSFNLGYLDGSLYITLSTRIPLRGERKWDWDKDTFKFTIYNWNGKSTSDELIERSQTHQL